MAAHQLADSGTVDKVYFLQVQENLCAAHGDQPRDRLTQQCVARSKSDLSPQVDHAHSFDFARGVLGLRRRRRLYSEPQPVEHARCRSEHFVELALDDNQRAPAFEYFQEMFRLLCGFLRAGRTWFVGILRNFFTERAARLRAKESQQRRSANSKREHLPESGDERQGRADASGCYAHRSAHEPAHVLAEALPEIHRFTFGPRQENNGFLRHVIVDQCLHCLLRMLARIEYPDSRFHVTLLKCFVPTGQKTGMTAFGEVHCFSRAPGCQVNILLIRVVHFFPAPKGCVPTGVLRVLGRPCVIVLRIASRCVRRGRYAESQRRQIQQRRRDIRLTFAFFSPKVGEGFFLAIRNRRHSHGPHQTAKRSARLSSRF